MPVLLDSTTTKMLLVVLMRYCNLKLRNKVKLNKEKQLLCQYAANCLSC